MDSLKIATFNCKNYKGLLREEFIRPLYEGNDFLCLQEHWMYKSEFNKFDVLQVNDIPVMHHGTSAMDPSVVQKGRSHGGTVILWKVNIVNQVTPIETISNRMSCVKIKFGDDLILLFSVYMPCDQNDRGDSFMEFQNILAEISATCQSKDAQNIIITGDLNSDLNRGSPQVEELKQFCIDESLYACVNSECSSVEYI